MKSDPTTIEAQLKATEEAIARHLDAIQDEVQRTGADVRQYVKENPWVGITASLAAGLVLGLVLSRKGRFAASHEEEGEPALHKMADFARESGISERELAAMLRDAVREAAPPPPARASAGGGVGNKLVAMLSGLVFDLAKRSIMNFVSDRLSARRSSANDSSVENRG
jgi:hypothetical protein